MSDEWLLVVGYLTRGWNRKEQTGFWHPSPPECVGLANGMAGREGAEPGKVLVFFANFAPSCPRRLLSGEQEGPW